MNKNFIILLISIISLAINSYALEINLTTLGADDKGNIACTPIFQKAIDSCSKSMGGTIILDKGIYTTGTLILKNNITIHIKKGAILRAIPDKNEYPSLNFPIVASSNVYSSCALLYAANASNITIEGEGLIDGNGRNIAFSDSSGFNKGERPYVIKFIKCSNIKIDGIKLIDSPFWMQHYLACNNLKITNINVSNHARKNNDGLDIDGCKNVVISNCIVDADDDGLCFKGTSDYVTENVVVTNSIFASNCNALKFGTETMSGFSNVAISNCVVKGSDTLSHIWKRNMALTGLAFQIVDGGHISNVTVNNCVIDNVYTPFIIRLGNRARPMAENIKGKPVGSIQGISISNIRAIAARQESSFISGVSGYTIKDISLSNISISVPGNGKQEHVLQVVPENESNYPETGMFLKWLPSYGLYIRHVESITLNNVKLRFRNDDYRPAIVCDDVKNLLINELDAQLMNEVKEPVMLLNSYNAIIKGYVFRNKQLQPWSKTFE